MKVWLVWTGQYSDASVVGVYSTRALAEAAAKMHGNVFSSKQEGWIDNEDGWEIDADAIMVRAGIGRWRVGFTTGGNLTSYVCMMEPGTGEPPKVHREFRDDGVWVECDARDEAHAIKIAADERAQFIALRANGISA